MLRWFVRCAMVCFLVLASLTSLHLAGLTQSGQGAAADSLPPFLQSTATPGPGVTATPTALPTRTVTPGLPSLANRYVVLIVLDGAQPAYFDVTGTPNLQALIRRGTVYNNAWAGILESETPSGHATISSGSPPRADGILSFAWASAGNPGLSMFNMGTVLNGDVERVIANSAAPTIAGLLHRSNPRARVVALSGYKYYAADAMGGPNADVIMYYGDRPGGGFVPMSIPGHVPPQGVMSAPGLAAPSRHYPLGQGNHLAMMLALSAFRKMRQQVTMINLPEFDWPLGHVWGASRDPKDVATLMRDFDRDLGTLEQTYRQAGVLNRTVFVITADHGFAPVSRQVPKAAIAQAVTAAGTSIVRDTYHTGAFLWLKDKGRAAQVAQNLVSRSITGVQSVYYRAVTNGKSEYQRASPLSTLKDMAAENANQYLLGTFNGPTGPDVVVQFNEGTAGLASGQARWKGDHGGADWDAQHLPLLLSGPGIRSGLRSSFPAPLMDLAPTVLSLLGATSQGMEGVPLADALQNATAAQHSAQDAQGAVLEPVISALQLESRLELNAGS